MISLCLAAAIDAKAEEVISLALPIKCQPGLTCFFQNYVDHDASDKARDYRCGGRSYDGHDGTDIRIRNLEIQRQGVEVLAAAPGRVIGGRNDMEDISVKTAGKAAIAGKECGNGVVIEHEGGWRTQYCHMAKGSVRVKVGDQMTTGQPIGLVGGYPAIPNSFIFTSRCGIAERSWTPLPMVRLRIPAAAAGRSGPLPLASRRNTGPAKSSITALPVSPRPWS